MHQIVQLAQLSFIVGQVAGIYVIVDLVEIVLGLHVVVAAVLGVYVGVLAVVQVEYGIVDLADGRLRLYQVVALLLLQLFHLVFVLFVHLSNSLQRHFLTTRTSDELTFLFLFYRSKSRLHIVPIYQHLGRR